SAMVTRYSLHAFGKAYPKKHGTHAFRRGIGARMLNAGVPVQTIQDVLGHSTSHALPQYTAVAWDGLRMCMPDFADVPVIREELK
ncbi:MAG: tyrosine-type recombinase/integrase, partial [Clostridia bacterium]|nr:tyrosine-type recombinase/integrase [Clostridia bacterium]